MQKLKQACLYCLHKLWLLCAVTLVLLATVVTLLRLGLPYAESYKTDIEQLIAEQYGTQVRIGQLSAGWQSTGPALLLQQVTLQDGQAQTVLQIDETRVKLDFWGSLRSLQLKAHDFELSGLKFQLDSQDLLETNTPSQSQDEPLMAAVEQLLFRQLKNFTLVDSELTLSSKFTPDIVIEISRLAWRNDGLHHQGSGEVAVAGITSNTSAFIIDLHGETLSSSRGQLYLTSQDLDVLPWFARFLPSNKKLRHAKINFQAWGDIVAGNLQQIQIALAENRLVWRQEEREQQWSLGQGQLVWRPHAEGWTLWSSPLSLSTQSGQWHDLTLQLTRRQGIYTGALQQLQLAAAGSLAQLFAEDSSTLQAVLAYAVDARLTQLAAQVSDETWFVSGDFVDLTSQPQADVPGVRGLNGRFSASADFIRLDLQGQEAELRWDQAFNRDTAYQQLSAHVEVLRQDTQWRIRVPRLSLIQPELELDVQMDLWLGEKPGMSLLGELRQVPLDQAQHYFPHYHMPKSVIDYLTPALQSGLVPKARVLWHGNFSDYPYAAHNGRFQAWVQVQQGEFSFDAEWPTIRQLDAEVLFDNASMLITSQSGNLFELPIEQGVTASIPNLYQADVLLIDIQRQTQASNVTGLMLASPLQNSVGATLDYLGVNGLVDAQVQLQIGLKASGVRALGKVDFFANELHIKAPAVDIEQLQGTLTFDNDLIQSEQLKFVSHGITLQASLKGKQQEEHYLVELDAQGDHDTEKLLGLISDDWPSLAQGPAHFDWDLNIQLPEEGFSYQSSVLVDLTATALNLPSPFGKSTTDGATLLFEAKGNQLRSDFKLQYGDQLRFLATLDQERQQITEALLSLGQPAAMLSPGFFIEVDLQKADLVPWISLIEKQLQESTQTTPALFPPLTEVRGKIGQLRLFNDVFLHQSQLVLIPQQDHWQLNMRATEGEGVIRFYHDIATRGIDASLQRLQLVFADQAARDLAAAELQAQLKLDPDSVEKPDYAKLEAEAFAALQPMPWLATMPPLVFNCEQCTLGDYELGQLSLQSHSDGVRWHLQRLESLYQGHRWQFQGTWLADDALGFSEFSGSLQSPAFGQLLKEYGLSSSLAGSRAELSFKQLAWQGAPFQLNWQTLSGDVNWQLLEGSLSEVSDGGARIFSLLSLDSLVRKLRLDFRDVFAKGFFFSKISGDITLDQGVALTENTEVLGAAGDIAMRGSTDLKSRALSYEMSFSPKVTSSIPVILAWMINPVSGVAALALDEVFQSAEVISKINFTVTGDLDTPIVTEVKRDVKKVPLPAGALPEKPATAESTPLLLDRQYKEAAPVGAADEISQQEPALTPTPEKPIEARLPQEQP